MRRLVALITLAFATACGQQSTVPSAADESLDLQADNIAFFVTHHMTTEGIRTATLEADTAFSFESARRLDFLQVKVVFYNEQGAETGTLTSRTADLNVADNVFIARDSVVLVIPGANGEKRLETDELHYDQKSKILWTDSPFVFYEDGRVSRGTRFRTDDKFQTWDVTGLETEGPAPGEGGLTF